MIVRIQPMVGQIDLSSMLSMYSGDSYPLHRKGLSSNIETLSSSPTFIGDTFSSLDFLSSPISKQLSLHNRHWPRLIIILLPTKLSQQRRSTARLQLTPPSTQGAQTFHAILCLSTSSGIFSQRQERCCRELFCDDEETSRGGRVNPSYK